MKRLVLMILGAVAGVALVLFLMDQTDGRIPTIEDDSSGQATNEQDTNEQDTNEQDTNEQAATDEGASNIPGNDGSDSSVSASAASALLTQPAPPADARPARVLRLADGDSFDMVWVNTDERDEIRLFGINAPEGDACFGQSAREVLQILTDDTDLLVETIQRDEFGRVLANVWSDDIFVNATLVELGAALALSDGGEHANLITDAQAQAKSTSAGLWDPAACGADPELDVRIAWIEANAPGRDDQNKNGEWIEIVNDAATDADLTGWSIRDESTRHRFSFPDRFTLAAGETVIVYSGCGADGANELFWCDADPVWNNGGDTGFLVDPDGRFADTRSYSG